MAIVDQFPEPFELVGVEARRGIDGCRPRAGSARVGAEVQCRGDHRESLADWTLARPVALSNKPGGAPLRAAEAGTDKPEMRISRADVADFLVDAVEQGTWIRKAPLVWNARG